MPHTELQGLIFALMGFSLALIQFFSLPVFLLSGRKILPCAIVLWDSLTFVSIFKEVYS